VLDFLATARTESLQLPLSFSRREQTDLVAGKSDASLT